MVIENKQIMSKNLLFIKAKSQISLEQHSTVMYIVNVNNYTLPPNRSKTNRIRTKKQTENHMVDFPASSYYIQCITACPRIMSP